MHPLAMPENAIAFSIWVLCLILKNTQAPVTPRLIEPDVDDDDRLEVSSHNVEN